MAESDSDLGELIRTTRERRKMTQAQLADRVGTTQQTIEKIELGKIKRSSFLPAVAIELGIEVTKVVRNPKPNAAVEIPANSLVGEEKNLRVYAATQGGSGALILSSEPVEWVVRPDPLARVRDGYGVIVIEDSMAPEFRSGDIALVNPHIPAKGGDTCIFRREDPDGTQVAIIKHLRRVTETAWHVTEWNDIEGNKRDFTLKRAEWQHCHVTVGKYTRR